MPPVAQLRPNKQARVATHTKPRTRIPSAHGLPTAAALKDGFTANTRQCQPAHTPAFKHTYMHAFCEHQACLSKQRLDAFMHAFIPPWSGRSSPQYYNTKYCTRRRQHHSISKRFSVCLRDYPYLQVYKYMIYGKDRPSSRSV